MKDTFVEQLIYWKNLAEMRALSYKQLTDYLKAHHPRVWQGYESKVLLPAVFRVKEEEQHD